MGNGLSERREDFIGTRVHLYLILQNNVAIFLTPLLGSLS